MAGITAVQEAGWMVYPPVIAVAVPFQALETWSGVERLALQLVTLVDSGLLRTRFAI